MDLLQPQQIFAHRYRIERFLAQGGMGAVFVGDHVTTEQRVAVKVLWPHVLSSKDAVEKFQLEAKVAGRVMSDHIVRMIDAGYDEETKMPFLVMELLDGRTLDGLVETGGPLPPDALVTYFRQVCSGLDKAHGYVDKDGVSKPIIHRDLKPENLFLTHRDSGEPLVKILDFGIAKVVSDQTDVSREMKGTPLFMAFEQLAGARVSPQTDIWALGLIVFFLLTGKHYWKTGELEDNGGLHALFAEVLTLPIVPPSARLAEYGVQEPLPPAFDAWFLQCVDREPARRFRSAGQAASALAEALGTEGLSGVSLRASTGGPLPKAAGLPSAIARTAASVAHPSAKTALADSAAPISNTHGVLAPPKKSALPVAFAAFASLAVAGGLGAFFVLRSSGGAPAPLVGREPTESTSGAAPLTLPSGHS